MSAPASGAAMPMSLGKGGRRLGGGYLHQMLRMQMLGLQLKLNLLLAIEGEEEGTYVDPAYGERGI